MKTRRLILIGVLALLLMAMCPVDDPGSGTWTPPTRTARMGVGRVASVTPAAILPMTDATADVAKTMGAPPPFERPAYDPCPFESDGPHCLVTSPPEPSLTPLGHPATATLVVGYPQP